MSMFEPAAPDRIVNLPDLTFWTETKFEAVKERFLAGASYTQLAVEFHTTRNAICGKLVRGGVYRVGKRVNGDRTYKPRGRYAKKLSPLQKCLEIGSEITDLPAEQPDNAKTFFELADHHCRWPCAGEGLQTTFCGGQAIGGPYSYCARHCRMAYEPARRRAA